MKIDFDGTSIMDEGDFHDALTEALDLSPFYGRNLAALWDTLTTDIEKPVQLIWNNSKASSQAMGDRFDAIVRVLQRVQRQDAEMGLKDRFELTLNP